MLGLNWDGWVELGCWVELGWLGLNWGSRPSCLSCADLWGAVGQRCGSGPPLSPILPPRLAEKKASIGYTYEDSTVAELENAGEKRGDDEESEEESNTDEDEVIPDIGERGGTQVN